MDLLQEKKETASKVQLSCEDPGAVGWRRNQSVDHEEHQFATPYGRAYLCFVPSEKGDVGSIWADNTFSSEMMSPGNDNPYRHRRLCPDVFQNLSPVQTDGR